MIVDNGPIEEIDTVNVDGLVVVSKTYTRNHARMHGTKGNMKRLGTSTLLKKQICRSSNTRPQEPFHVQLKESRHFAHIKFHYYYGFIAAIANCAISTRLRTGLHRSKWKI